VPRGKPGLAGDQEAAAFARLPAPDARDVERVAHLVLMQLLPALAEADLMGFGAALEEVQRITGGWFAPVQGGVFAPGETRDVVGRWLSPVGNVAPRSVRSAGRPMGMIGVDRFSPSSSST